MCSNIIIDVNKASGFTNPNSSKCDDLLYGYIQARHFKVVRPHPKDPFFKKDRKNNKWNNLLDKWKSSGMTVDGPKELSHSIQSLKKNNKRRLSDPHILALAKDTGTSILYTDDKRLIKDFKDSQIIGMSNAKRYCYIDNDYKKAESFLEKHKCPKRK